jgi:hypothetical protein
MDTGEFKYYWREKAERLIISEYTDFTDWKDWGCVLSGTEGMLWDAGEWSG